MSNQYTCKYGHKVGFRRDESRGEGWYTVRCVQCGEQQIVPFHCPFCKSKGVHMWFNDFNKDLILIRCANCGNWITNKDENKFVLQTSLQSSVLALLGAVLGAGIGFLVFKLGLSYQSALLIGIASGIIGCFVGMAAGWRIIGKV